MYKVIIDGDPGHDDTLAFLVTLAHAEMFDIVGYTTVVGNSTVNNLTNNILRVQDYFGTMIPVAKGYGSPLIRDLDTASKFHGPSGLDGAAFLPQPHSRPVGQHAIQFLKETILASKEPITLITMGPLTNIAMLLKTYPEVKQNIRFIAMMGGCYNLGNALAKSEFNIYHDPEAAKIVFESGVEIYLATIDACYGAGILIKDNEKLKGGGKASNLAYRILQFYCRYAISNGWDRTPIFDVTPVIYLLRPDLFTVKDYKVTIETSGELTRGMTICDDRGPVYVEKPDNPVHVLMSCNSREAFSDLFFDSFRMLDEQYR